MTGSPGSLAVLAGTFREVMAGVCTPVAVVTTMTESGPYGTTVSAFSSLSLSPPMVMVALDERSELLRRLAVGSPLGVNVLRSGQSALARVFARKGPDKFSGLAWDLDAGAPRLDGGAGWLGGSVSRLVAGGDHVIVLAEVLRADPGNGDPLTYHARTFGTHVAVAG